MRRDYIILCVAPLWLASCAGSTHRTVEGAVADLKATGIRYYDTSPYVFIRTDNKGGLKSEFVYLPDPTKKRSVHPYAVMAKNKTVLTWNPEGTVLTGSSTDADSGEVPAAIVGALKDAALTAVGKAFDTGEAAPNPVNAPASAPEAYLFKVVKKDGQWGLEGASTGRPVYKSR